MQKFKGFILFSDLDGTLFDDKTRLPKRNEEMIRYFIGEGGLFSVATGRSNYSLVRFIDAFGINAPCITQNGCCIYDFQAQESLHDIFLNESARKITREIYKEFPDLNVVMMDRSGLNVLNDPATLPACFDVGFVPVYAGTPESAIEPWYKVLFVGEFERLKALRTELEKTDLEETDIVFSGIDMLELMPSGISKGFAMLDIAKRLGIEQEYVCAIGDYFNDLDMIEKAGFGATMEDSPEEIRMAAQFVACNHNEGSVGHFIEWLAGKF